MAEATRKALETAVEEATDKEPFVVHRPAELHVHIVAVKIFLGTGEHAVLLGEAKSLPKE